VNTPSQDQRRGHRSVFNEIGWKSIARGLRNRSSLISRRVATLMTCHIWPSVSMGGRGIGRRLAQIYTFWLGKIPDTPASDKILRSAFRRMASAWVPLPFIRTYPGSMADARPETSQQAVAILEEKHALPSESAAREAFIDLSIQGWRFARVFGRLLPKLDAGEAPRYANQQRYFQKKIDDGLREFGLHIVSLEGQPYDAGMAVSALNIGDFGPDDKLVVEQMVVPLVMGPDGLVRGGTVVLAKVSPQ
jgi:hypothetical protein